MADTKEQRDELKEKIELAHLEIAALEESEQAFKASDGEGGHFPKSMPATRKFMEARLKYVQKKLTKLRKQEQSNKEYDEWEQRTKA